MPRSDGMALDPGRARESERKRDEGAEIAGEMPKRLDANGAPSRPFPVTGVICCAMTELRGRARPRMPLNSCSRGSESTLVAEARQSRVNKEGGLGVMKVRTQSLVIDGVWTNLHFIPVYRSTRLAGEVCDLKIRPRRVT